MAVFNFTNRMSLPRDGIFLSIGASDNKGKRCFSFRSHLVGDWYKEHSQRLSEASISFRFRDKVSGRTYPKRISFNKFVDSELYSSVLEDFNINDDIPLCDINIIDKTGLIIFTGKRYKVHDERTDALAKPSSILPVKSVDLDGLLYKLDYSNDITGPILLLNKTLHIKSKLRQPLYLGLILVPVIEQILTYAIFVQKQDIRNPTGWFQDWLNLFPFSSPEYHENEEIENNTPALLDWIERVVSSYADSQEFINKILMEEENASSRN